jgi:mRNA deadenylase 3'-5' endonuclease subunit Ccr4
MSFNIRYGTAKDGEDRWEKRQDLLVDTIRAYTPDLLGMQEVLAAQADFLREKLPGYGFCGTGRDEYRSLATALEKPPGTGLVY